MFSVKNLLLQPPEAHDLYPTIPPTNTANSLLNTHHSLTICRPRALNFRPSTPPHTLSRMQSSNFEPQPPSPLTIFTPRDLSIPPHTPPYDSQEPAGKRRKILPPEVDLGVSAISRISTTPSTLISPVPGMHIWEITSQLDPNQFTWSTHKREDGEEYKILIAPAPTEEWFTVQMMRTGKRLQMKLLEEDQVKPNG